jgi:hypothetical protein
MLKHFFPLAGARTIALTAIVFAACLTAPAQEFRGTITGTVTDPQGAVIAGADIQLQSIETNTIQKTTTNASGLYVLTFLTVGHYNVSASSTGFKRELRNNIEIRVGDRLQVDFTLRVGSMNEELTVMSDSEILETQDASHGQSIDLQTVADMPLLGRNPVMLTLLSTGITWANPQPSGSERPWDNNGMENFNMNGSQGLTNQFLLDGLPNVSVENTGPANLTLAVSPDATEQFKVQTSAYDAEYGRTGGGTVNITLKSGTNLIHGALYDYERNTVFNANLFQSNAAGIARAPFHWHQPGVEFDGPVLIPGVYNGRNKTFFMTNLEWVRLNQPATNVDTVPTLAERTGDFSGLVQANGSAITIYDPMTKQVVNGQNLRTAFPGNMIPANRLNPTALAILNYIPLPNAPGTSTGLNNFVTSTYNKVQYSQQVARIDHYINQGERLSLRGERNGDEAPGGPTGFLGTVGYAAGYARKNRGGGMDLTSTLSPTMVLVSRAGFEQHKWEYSNPGYPFDLSTIGISQSLISQLPVQSFPSISLSNYTGFGPGRNIGNEFNVSSTWAWSEVLSKTAGKHSLKFGFDFWVMLNNQREPTSSFGTLAFTNAWSQQNALTSSASSGNAVASFLMGYPASGSVLNNQAMAYSSHYWAGFVQDDYRITRKLTLNLGLRWDYESPITDRYNRLSAGFNPTATNPFQVPGLPLQGGLTFVGSGNRLPFNRDLNNIQPRFGLAYQITSKLVFRGGYAISYLPTFDLPSFSSFNTTTAIAASSDGGITPAVTITNPYPGGILHPTGSSLGLATLVGQAIAFGNPDRKIPYVHQFSAGFQELLPWKAVLDLSYVGSRTHDMQVSRNINALPVQDLAMGNALNNPVANPFAGLLPQAPSLNGATVTQQQLLLPFPQFQAITENDLSIGYASYDSLQAKIEKRFAQNFHAVLSYTWDKALQATNYLNNGQDPIHKLARTLSSFDEPYRISLSGGYELPKLEHVNRYARGALGGWQANMITTWQAGRPVTEPDAYPTGINPALSGDQQTLNQWFNTCTLSTAGVRQNCASATQPVAWLVRPAFTQRTTSTYFPNIGYPRPMLMDASIFKNFQLHERLKMQFRLEAFNVTNTTWFSSPGTTISSTSFGVITPTQANDPRNAQLALRLMF